MQQDVPEVVVDAALVEQLDDVESELRLDDLRDLPGLHPFERLAERLVEIGQRRRIHLAAAHHRTRVLRIHAGQVLELGGPRDDALAHVDQTFARALLGGGHRAREAGDLRIDILLGDGRQAVLRNRLVVALHLAGDDRHLADHLVLHGVGVGLLLVALAHVLADVEDGHVVLGLEPRDGALVGDHLLQLLLHARSDLGVVDLHRVDLRLVVEQFLGHEPFERLVHRVAVGGVALLTALRRELAGVVLHLRIEDRGASHHGDHLVEQHLPLLGERPRHAKQEQRRKDRFLQHAYRVIRSCRSPLRRRKSSPRRSPCPGRRAPPRACG